MAINCLCSLLEVSDLVEAFIAFSSPFSVKFAKVGDIIPPCGVPVSVVSNLPLSTTPLFNHSFTNVNGVLCRNKFLISQL